MKIIAWNCNMAFRKKNSSVLKCKPDIVIASECENGERLEFGKLTPTPNDFHWYGSNANKGIGIFSYSKYKFRLIEDYTENFRYIIPLEVIGEEKFNLFAVWAMNDKDHPENRYIGQVWLAINRYGKYLNDPSILMGDFNSNKIWDYKERVGNLSKVVEYLKSKNIVSLYHDEHNEEQGRETRPTLFMYRNLKKTYHVDYCFASSNLFTKGYDLEIGKYEEWNKDSDHVPICASITF
jgi:exodeoxyribonuclease III